MLFNSIEFAFFFPVVVALFFATPSKYRWILLLSASYYFYACWKIEYLGLIMASTLVDYWAALQMAKHDSIAKRRPYLVLSLLTNLGILFSFKYFNFLSGSAEHALGAFNLFYDLPYWDVLLPVGISFYTFQTLAYSIDVYRGYQKPERHLGYFALYVSFFPQLVAGPIERSGNLLPQFRKAQKIDYHRIMDGLKLMLWGLFKKIVIADRLALYVNEVYNNPEMHTGMSIILATYFFAFQIYCDFSGYSDIAIGAARVLGFKLMDNFDRPYFSKSINEFWHRWHISLSTWFRDYLYIPLGGNRVVKWRWYYNLFIVFLISGLWHGANWTFVFWGGLHGFYLIAGIITRDFREKSWNSLHSLAIPKAWILHIRKWSGMLFTFHLVLFGWLFFRANSLSDAFTLLNNAFSFGSSWQLDVRLPDFGSLELALAFACILFMEAIHLCERKDNIRTFLNERPAWTKWAFYHAVIIGLLIFGVYEKTEFIYFQF